MSTLKADTIQSTGGGAATLTKQHAAKQWVNITGTGTPSANDSFNTSSITDTGTGYHTPNLTNAMGNANYAYNFTVQRAANNDVLYVTHRYNANPTTSAYTPRTFHTDNDESPTGEDPNILCCAIYGDLA